MFFSCFNVCGNVHIQEETIEIPYGDKYKDIFDTLVILDDPISIDNNTFVLENTPSGNVIMSYNQDENVFYYYCNKQISNDFLETVARKYVIQNNCKHIYHLKNENTTVSTIKSEKIPDVYGKFKKKRVEKRKLIESNINCYKHLGKLNDFNIIQKTTVLKKPVIPLSYADFIKQ